MVNAESPHFKSYRSAPNLLTLLRICMMPFLVAAVLEGRYGVAFWLFLVAGLTDALDGTLARILQQKTTLGQYLDPVADKLLLTTLFVVLTLQRLIPRSVTALVFGRDLIILVVAALLYATAGRREFSPSIFGKANTVAQVTAVAVVLLHQINAALWIWYFRQIAVYASMALTIVSGLHYAWRTARLLGGSPANGTAAGQGSVQD